MIEKVALHNSIATVTDHLDLDYKKKDYLPLTTDYTHSLRNPLALDLCYMAKSFGQLERFNKVTLLLSCAAELD